MEYPKPNVDQILGATHLSWAARGLLIYIIYNGYTPKKVAMHSKEGVTRTRTIFRELERAGIAARIQRRNERGQVVWSTAITWNGKTFEV